MLYIPLDEQDVSHIARWFRRDSKPPQDFFLMENKMYPTEILLVQKVCWHVRQNPCKMKQNQQNQIRQRYFNTDYNL